VLVAFAICVGLLTQIFRLSNINNTSDESSQLDYLRRLAMGFRMGEWGSVHDNYLIIYKKAQKMAVLRIFFEILFGLKGPFGSPTGSFKSVLESIIY
jgi:hypothetical protein